jgi:hypothetical protein
MRSLFAQGSFADAQDDKQAGPAGQGRRGQDERFAAGRTLKEKPRPRPGLQSLIAVITLRRLLREEKQGMTALRLSFEGYFSRAARFVTNT